MMVHFAILFVFCYLAIKAMGMKGALLIVAIGLFIVGLSDSYSAFGGLGVILFIVWFVWMSASGLKNPEVKKEMSEKTKKQKKEEEEWGIINFSDKK